MLTLRPISGQHRLHDRIHRQRYGERVSSRRHPFNRWKRISNWNAQHRGDSVLLGWLWIGVSVFDSPVAVVMHPRSCGDFHLRKFALGTEHAETMK